ncbi:MAG: PepSY domain-containing protein [Bacteroidaceae bacterium]|nr:PepSY domain-containing protein [Bacteroidaceae bacterium]
MRTFFRKFHLWVSLPFGFVITITCFTGALLVFEKEITALCNDDIAAVTPVGEPLPLDVIADKVDATLPADVDVKGVVVSSSPDEAYRVNLSKPKKAAIYVNQYTGEVIGKDERLPFFQTIFRLHRWLMDSNPGEGNVFWGRIIVGASTLAFVVILLTGLVIWWPLNSKMLKNRLQIVLKKGKNRFWHDLHVAGGFYALLLLLAMALTGLTWSFEWYRSGFYDLFDIDDEEEVEEMAVAAVDVVVMGEKTATGTASCPGSCGSCTLPVCVYSAEDSAVAVEQPAAAEWNVDAVTAATKVADTKYVDAEPTASIAEIDGVTAATVVDAQSGATALVDGSSGATPQSVHLQKSAFDSWQTALENVLERVPGFEAITVSAGTVSVKMSEYGNVRAADKYIFDDCGVITRIELYEESSYEKKIAGWIYSVHTGSWGGLFVRILYFLAALLGATLPLTGYYLWIKRLYGKRKNRK